jgi:hypothetical protein
MAYVKSREDLVQHFNETKSALLASCQSFDNGNRWEAGRIATATYALLHDGGRNSRSVLTQLGLRGSLRFPSRVNIRAGNLLADTPLVFYRVTGDGSHACLPILGERVGDDPQMLQFSRWWDQVILADGPTFQLTRKGMVFSLRNQDGGAHVDPELKDAAYVRFARINPSTPRMISSSAGQQPFTGIAEASMRHVAWELLKSLDGLGEVK